MGNRDLKYFLCVAVPALADGEPIDGALKAAAESATTRSGRRALKALREDVGGGQPLHEAMARHPSVFSPGVVAIVEMSMIGEDTDGAMQRLSEWARREARGRSVVVQAVFRAVALVTVVAAAILAFSALGPSGDAAPGGRWAAVPVGGRLLVSGAAALADLLPWMTGLAVLAAVVAVISHRAGRLGSALLRIPGLRGTIRDIAVARFSRWLAISFKSGVPILEGLVHAANATGLPEMRSALRDVRLAIREGDGDIHGNLMRTGWFEPVEGALIEVGEETGKLDDAMIRVAELRESRLAYRFAVPREWYPSAIAVLAAAASAAAVIALFMRR